VGSVTVPERPPLLDTVAFIFWHSDSPRLSSVARAALLEAPRRVVYVSAASAFEIATQVRLEKLSVPQAILNDFGDVVEADGFRLLDIDAESAVRAGQFASLHRDPFDRLIAAQSLTLNGTVVTNDAAFAEFGIPVLW
jgi:PIN domain nuclease of toxin-antitoxin system